MFKYNGKIWDPKNPEKKLKQLGITWDDVEIIEKVEKPKNTDSEPDWDKCKEWIKIKDLSTNAEIITINKGSWRILLSKLTTLTDINEYETYIMVNNRFVICNYLDEYPESVYTIGKANMLATKDGYSYIDITDCLIDLLLCSPGITDAQLAEAVLSDEKIIWRELIAAHEAVNNGAKYVPYKDYVQYYRTHSKEQIMKYFNLNEEQYKTTQKKFGLYI